MLNLSSEEKQRGREAFGQVSRRGFLKTSALAVGVPTAGLGAFYFGYQAIQGNPVRVAVLGTGDQGSVLIGAINPNYVEVRAIADLRPYNQWRAFHGDHYSPAALAARKGLMNVYGWKTEDEARKHVAVYTDFRALLDDYKKLGIEAVIIGLPLHLHAPAAIQAMKRGLHVLTEKLMGHSVADCKAMARAADLAHRHLATGHQRHYNILYHEAVDMIRRGVIGDIHYIRAQWHRSNMPGNDSWQMPMPANFKPEDVYYTREQLARDRGRGRLERELDNWRNQLRTARGREIEEWAIKVKQKEMQIADSVLADGGDGFLSAKEAGYLDANIHGYDRPAAEELLRWRLWDRTGGGLMVELGSHQLDASGIFITAAHALSNAKALNDPTAEAEKQHPLSVMVASNRPIFGNDREAMDHLACIFEYAAPGYNPETTEGRLKKIGVHYSTINGNGFGGYGEVVYGTQGTIVLEREQDSQLFRDESASKVSSSGGGGPALDTQASGPPQAATGGGASVEVSRGYQEEIEHWAWCIRVNPQNRDKTLQPRCCPKVALSDAVIALTTNIAAEQGRRVQFEEAWFDPNKDDTPEGVVPNPTDEKYA